MNTFEKEVIERLTRIETQNKTQFERIENLEKSLNGNGKKGLFERVQKLESEQEDCTDLKEKISVIEQKINTLENLHTHSDKTKSNFALWIGLLFNAFATLYAIFKHHNT